MGWLCAYPGRGPYLCIGWRQLLLQAGLYPSGPRAVQCCACCCWVGRPCTQMQTPPIQRCPLCRLQACLLDGQIGYAWVDTATINAPPHAATVAVPFPHGQSHMQLHGLVIGLVPSQSCTSYHQPVELHVQPTMRKWRRAVTMAVDAICKPSPFISPGLPPANPAGQTACVRPAEGHHCPPCPGPTPGSGQSELRWGARRHCGVLCGAGGIQHTLSLPFPPR